MIEHLCPPHLCWLHRRETLFNNNHIHDYPQWHEIRTDLPIDEVILRTGMVTSKSKLKRLYRQDAIHQEGNFLRIGQRHLLFREKEDISYEEAANSKF